MVLTKKIEEYFKRPRSFFKFVVRIIDYLKFNQEILDIRIPVFDYGEIRFTEDFDEYEPTNTMECFKLRNPFYKGMSHYEGKEWWLFKEILKKFEEKQKDLNREFD